MDGKAKIEELENRLKQLELDSLHDKIEELEKNNKKLKREYMVSYIFICLVMAIYFLLK